jgi:hypothetical protein
MNAARRKELEAVHSMLEELRDQERAAFENMPESLQASKRAEDMESAADSMDEALDAIQSAIDAGL